MIVGPGLSCAGYKWLVPAEKRRRSTGTPGACQRPDVATVPASSSIVLRTNRLEIMVVMRVNLYAGAQLLRLNSAGVGAMGLSDVLNGMKNGPGGGASSSSPSGGMSPLTMGLLAFLAYKALKGSGVLGTESPLGKSQSPGSASSPSDHTSGASDWLTGLQKVIAGGGAGGILSGGLTELLKKFQQAGQGQAAESWVGTGPNQSIPPEDLEKAIGAETLDAVAQRMGIPRDRLLAELKEMLPSTVDALTPDGRLPDEKEAARWG